MRYGSLCSGIEAATVAWHPLGFEPAFFSEIDKSAARVLAHHYPHVPNHGDMTKFQEWPDHAIDLLVGGTPCQSFSVAGLRKGMADPRGNLALTYLAVADRYRPRRILWENVPGVLSSNGGRDFGAFLGGLGELGYGWAYRVLDAQYVRVDGFGRAVPQRRRRVFVVGDLGGWQRAAAVLFERESLCWHSPPRREARQGFAHDVASSLVSSGRGVERTGETRGQDPVVGVMMPEIANPLTARMHKGINTTMDEGQTMVAHALRAEGFDASEDGTGRGTPLVPEISGAICRDSFAGGPGGRPEGAAAGHFVPVVFDSKGTEVQFDDKGGAPTLRSMGHANSHQNGGGQLAVAFAENAETKYGVKHADAKETHAAKALRELREAVGEKTFAEWGSGVVAAFRAQEILRSEVHGAVVRREADERDSVDDDALPRTEANSSWTVQSLWEAGCVGRAPSGWGPSEQLTRELGAHLSLLSHKGASAEGILQGLWSASEGLGIVRQTLSKVQEVRRPAHDKSKPTHTSLAVRRLTPREAERLQGFPDDYTLLDGAAKPQADGPRYKQLGNSMAVNVMRWIGTRMVMVDEALGLTRDGRAA